MAKGGREYKSEFNTTAPNNENKDELIDKNINFDNQDMHKSWPMVKGCLILAAAITAFIFISLYIFKNFHQYFG